MDDNTLIDRYLEDLDESGKCPEGKRIKVPEVRETFENLKILFIGASGEIDKLLTGFNS